MKKAAAAPANSGDVFRDEVTGKLLQLLEQVDPKDYRLPWHRTGTIFGVNSPMDPRNATTMNPYRGINWLILALVSGIDPNGPRHASCRYATFKQWQSIGGQVRAGSRGYKVVKVGTFTPKDAKTAPPAPGEDARVGNYLKVYTVFAAEQVDGVEAAAPPPVLAIADRNAAVDAFIASTQADIRAGGDRACCVTSGTGERWIHMPDFGRFTSQEGYYATILHELVHWTGYPVGRHTWLSEHFSDLTERYAFEELVAELGSAMLCAQLGVSAEPRPDHAAYLANWIQALRNDTTYIMKAAAQAQKAVEFLLELTGNIRAPAVVAEPEEVAA